MQQLRLVSGGEYAEQKQVTFEHVKAYFHKITTTLHEVVLEINSHKFLINFKAGLKKLEQFEIIAVKGFIEVGMKIVHVLKRLVTALYFEH